MRTFWLGHIRVKSWQFVAAKALLPSHSLDSKCCGGMLRSFLYLQLLLRSLEYHRSLTSQYPPCLFLYLVESKGSSKPHRISMEETEPSHSSSYRWYYTWSYPLATLSSR